jgi:hypothetical protein
MSNSVTQLVEVWIELATVIHRLGDAKTPLEKQALVSATRAMEKFNAAHPEVMVELMRQQGVPKETDITAVVKRTW